MRHATVNGTGRATTSEVANQDIGPSRRIDCSLVSAQGGCRTIGLW